LQVVVRPAECGIAAGDEIRLLLASSGLAQIAFSTGRLAVAQLKLGLL
jgi:hypothetical protein